MGGTLLQNHIVRDGLRYGKAHHTLLKALSWLACQASHCLNSKSEPAQAGKVLTLEKARLCRPCTKLSSCVIHRQQLKAATPVSLLAEAAGGGGSWGKVGGRTKRPGTVAAAGTHSITI